MTTTPLPIPKLNFLKDPQYHRKCSQKGTQDPLSKALGNGKGRFLLDATAGLGEDSIYFAQKGFRVLGIECHPQIFDLLQNALQNALLQNPPQKLDSNSLQYDPWIHRIHFFFGEALTTLNHWHLPELPEIIYLDPMFPPNSKKALPRKKNQWLRQITSEIEPPSDQFLQQLLDTSRQMALSKVILKRPLKCQKSNLQPKPAQSFLGHCVKYEVYPSIRKIPPLSKT